MPTHKAIGVTSVGFPVELITRPTPQPGPNQILVRVTVAAVNPHDGKGRDWGLLVAEQLPGVLANDVAGVVAVVGPSVHKYKVGDRIFGQAYVPNDQKGLQEYAILDEKCTAKIPEALTDHDVATLPTNLIASVVALFDKTGLGIPPPWSAAEDAKTFDYAGTQILIIGGGSNCGRFGVQLAHLAGIGKIVVVGGDETQLKTLGATHVLDRHGGHEAVLQRIRHVVGDELIYAYDAVSDVADQVLGINALSDHCETKIATLVSKGPVNGFKIPGTKPGCQIWNIFGSSHAKPESCDVFWENVGAWLTEGRIVPGKYVVVEGLDAQRANEVFDRYRRGERVVQTHFRISE